MVTGGRTDHLADWMNAHIGLAMLFVVAGDDAGADRVVSELAHRVAGVDPASVARWRAYAQSKIAEIRALRPEN